MRRGLKNGRPAQTSMREQQIFAKRLAAAGYFAVHGHAAELGELFFVGIVLSQRHQGGAGGNDAYTQIPRGSIGKVRGNFR